ncbi:hypothetical protein pipiens_014642 [Culex pipiens pipiens]|uniref:Uncharacterized protein n=1 Tax=Culex pipiens pipiens TaxID=38569 RepID=A0ABD1CTN7_CULPP
MVKLVIVALVVCLQLAQSLPVAPAVKAVEPVNEDTSVLAEFDRLFNQLHYDIDYKLRIYRMNFSRSIKNLNAQFISRYGFVITDIQHMKQQAKDAILEHALDVIGDTQNPCIVASNDEAIRRATQAARDLSVVSERAYGSLALYSRILVRPYIDAFQDVSSGFQSTVLGQLAQRNAVVGLQDILADLAFQYLGTPFFVDLVALSLDNQLEVFELFMNALRRDVFKSVDDIARDYIYNMEQLIEEAQQCA